jgi:hypothetical protein
MSEVGLLSAVMVGLVRVSMTITSYYIADHVPWAVWVVRYASAVQLSTAHGKVQCIQGSFLSFSSESLTVYYYYYFKFRIQEPAFRFASFVQFSAAKYLYLKGF